MQIKRTDAHDRLIHFKEQADLISQGCKECIENRPQAFGNHPFYIFAHSRSVEIDEKISIFTNDLTNYHIDPSYKRKYLTLSDIPSARFIWAPRLTKPFPQSNSMLFKAYPPGDNIKVIWMIPSKELWGQYNKGNMTENKTVVESIHDFIHDPKKMAAREEDDLSDEMIDRIYEEIKMQKTRQEFKLI